MSSSFVVTDGKETGKLTLPLDNLCMYDILMKHGTEVCIV